MFRYGTNTQTEFYNMSMIDVTPNTPTNSGAFKVANLYAGESKMDLSLQWQARPHDQRYLSLSDLWNAVHNRSANARQAKLRTSEIQLIAPEPTDKAATHRLTAEINGGEVAFSNWSFGQTCNLAGAPASYLRTLPSQMVAPALQYGLRYNRKVDMVKAYDNGDSLMAMTGPDYGRIFDYEVVDAVQGFVEGTHWKVP